MITVLIPCTSGFLFRDLWCDMYHVSSSVLEVEKMFDKPCCIGSFLSVASSVHSLHRKQENMKFQSEVLKPVCVFQYGHIRTLLAFSRSVTLTPLVTSLTPPPCSLHWIWASLYLSSRGHHTSPGEAEPPDYFSSPSTVIVQQQQQFVQFLILCSHSEDFQCKVPSQPTGNQCEASAINCI